VERCVGEEAIAQAKSVDEGLREKMGEVRLTQRFLKLEKPFSVDAWLALSGPPALKEADKREIKDSSLDSGWPSGHSEVD
jgi:hypothetical protein